MPETLREHLRYPLDLFQVQASVYQTYHMTDPRVFYNKEDLWTIPVETYAANRHYGDYETGNLLRRKNG